MQKTDLKIKDYAFSQEEFNLIYEKDLDKYTTYPIPENLDHYYKTDAYISHTDSKSGLVDRIYQLVKSYMLKKKLSLIEKYVSKNTLLDIGAGTGDFLKAAEERKWKIAGVEPSSIARANAAKKGLRLYESQEDLETKKFAAITMWHVLEHVPDVERQIKWLQQHLDQNGIAVVAVPNFNSFDAKHYKQFWAAWDVPRHLHHFSAKSIKSLFETQGFKLIEQKPLIFDSFYVSLLSEKYKKRRFKFLSAFGVGLLSNLKAIHTGEYSSLIYVFKRSKT